MNSRNIDLATLEELKNKAGLNEAWFEQSLTSLSICWNRVLAGSLYSYLITKLNGDIYTDYEFDLPTNTEELPGQIELGHVLGRSEIKFRIPVENICRHILIAGNSGSGKTNFSALLAEQVIKNSIKSVSIIDPKSDEYLKLAQKHLEFLIIRWSDLRFNIFSPPPRVPWIEWQQLVVTHMSHAFNFWEGGEAMLIYHLEKNRNHPTGLKLGTIFNSLYEQKRLSSQKDAMIRSTLISRLQLLDILMGKNIDSDSDMLEWLTDHQYVLSTSGLMDQSDSWLSEFLLLWEFMYRVYNPDKRILALRIFDECQHRLFSSHKERKAHQTGAPLISRLVDESRALNLGFCSLTQEPSTIIRALINNSGVKTCFHLGSGSEIRVIKDAMGLDEAQAKLVHDLEPGEGIVRLASGFKEPFPVKIDLFQPSFQMSQAEFHKYQNDKKERLYKESVSNPTATTAVMPNQDFEEQSVTAFEKNQSITPATGIEKGRTNELARKITKLWLNLPDFRITWSQLLSIAGITSGSTKSKLKNQMLKLGFMKEHRLQVGKGFIIVPEPTDVAYQLAGIIKPQLNSKGGYLHQFIAKQIEIWARQKGYFVDIEYLLDNNKSVDVVLRREIELIFIEIAVSRPFEKELENVLKDFDSIIKPSKLVIAAVDASAKTKLLELIFNDDRINQFGGKVQVVLAGDFLRND